jgi:hypothetical protein
MPAANECGPVRLSYFLRIPNVGDRLSPAIVTAVSGRPTVHFAAGDAAHLLAVGSMMATATPDSVIWGAGVMREHGGVGAVDAANIHALRGKLSCSALRRAGVAAPDVPLGDPGFLAPALLGIAKTASPANRIGVVPHYVDRASPHFRRLLAEPGVVDLNVHDGPERFLRAMADCEVVISSSLHGLIFAEALGIPNLWVVAGGDIGGGAFKFNDWFSTTARPQTSALVLTPDVSVAELTKQATLHESMIETEAIRAAFPSHRLDELCETKGPARASVDACRSRPIPAFLISFNRGVMLERAIASLKKLRRATDVVVHDNGSTDPATLAILDDLEKKGTRVVRGGPIESADDLLNVNDTIRQYFSDWAEPSRYIVSDCDIDMAISAPDALEVYDELLNVLRAVEKVGPMLKIQDIPAAYPLYNHVINRHIEQFWHKEPEWTETSFGRVAHITCWIDTTLALHRAGEPFRRNVMSIRVYYPYEAQHLDWYIGNIGDDVYSRTSSPTISHWNNIVERDINSHARLIYERYNAVRRNSQGELEVYEETVSPNPSAKMS